MHFLVQAESFPMGDTSTPPNGASLLLSLPIELRDEIYQHALTFMEGLFATSMKVATYLDPVIFCRKGKIKEKEEYNQIKYVCRQLYNETSGLGLSWNSLHFRDSLKEFAFRNRDLSIIDDHLFGRYHFQGFLSTSSSTTTAKLRSVNFHEGPVDPMSFYGSLHSIKEVLESPVVDFARGTPGCTITVTFCWLDKFEPRSRLLDNSFGSEPYSPRFSHPDFSPKNWSDQRRAQLDRGGHSRVLRCITVL
jgi:hypothetical protein